MKHADGRAGVTAAPIELTGDWGQSAPEAALVVAERIRDACFAGVDLRSDRQPERLRIEHRAVDYPAIWLHDGDPGLAWVLVVIGASDWCQLAYEFGHELGHVLCNSWDEMAVPRAPCQWLEESLAEAFALRGLAILAERWESDPPFAGDAGFSQTIRHYHRHHLERCEARLPPDGVAAWFHAGRAALEANGAAAGAEAPVTLAVLAALQANEAWIGDLGALNRWPTRSAAPLDDYLRMWEASCAEIGTPGRLPIELDRLLNL